MDYGGLGDQDRSSESRILSWAGIGVGLAHNGHLKLIYSLFNNQSTDTRNIFNTYDRRFEYTWFSHHQQQLDVAPVKYKSLSSETHLNPLK